MKATPIVSVLLVAGLASVAHADRIAVVANPVGLPLGLGADVCYRLSDRFSLRVGGGLPATGVAEGVELGETEYEMTVKLGGLSAFAEWHPFGGDFHLGGGVVTIRSPWTLKAASASSYTINGTRYPAADVGTLQGEFRMGYGVAPALLLGWGNAVRRGRRLGLVLDVGLAYVGSERLVLEANGPLAGDLGFQRDLVAENARHSSRHAVWPILTLGVSYQF